MEKIFKVVVLDGFEIGIPEIGVSMKENREGDSDDFVRRMEREMGLQIWPDPFPQDEVFYSSEDVPIPGDDEHMLVVNYHLLPTGDEEDELTCFLEVRRRVNREEEMAARAGVAFCAAVYREMDAAERAPAGVPPRQRQSSSDSWELVGSKRFLVQ